jgi:hypothetical protein
MPSPEDLVLQNPNPRSLRREAILHGMWDTSSNSSVQSSGPLPFMPVCSVVDEPNETDTVETGMKAGGATGAGSRPRGLTQTLVWAPGSGHNTLLGVGLSLSNQGELTKGV